MTNEDRSDVPAIWGGSLPSNGFRIPNAILYASTTIIAWLLSLFSAPMYAAQLPPDWQYFQSVHIDRTGLVKMSIPIETLDASRSGLEDLRLLNATGNEVPFRIERPAPAAKIVKEARNFGVRIEDRSTIVTFETDLTRPIERVTLATPSHDFIKAATLEGSTEGATWQVIALAQPIFRQRGGASRLHLEFPAGTYAHLRVTLDDSRTGPIPVTSAQVHAADLDPAPAEPLDIKVLEHDESEEQTRLTIQTAGAHVTLSGVTIETTDPLFTREVSLAYRSHKESEVSETTLARGTIYRAALEGQATVSSLTFAGDVTIPMRELILTIRNGDSPPLSITGIRAALRPVFISWLAKEPGDFLLLSGNPSCPAPRYDLTALPPTVAATLVTPPSTGSVARNPDWRAGGPIADIQEVGTAIDLSKWPFRKRIDMSRAGVQQVELDLETLSRAAPGLQDIRLIRDGRQLPFLIERTPIVRTLTPIVEKADDPKRPTTSRWTIRFPNPSLPVNQLTCEAVASLFKREVQIAEDVPDKRGNPHKVMRGSATWTRTLGEKAQKLIIKTASPVTDRLILEIQNGDNPPLDLKEFRAYYTATRVIFKSSADGEAYLYYGNRSAPVPSYDINLVATQLLAEEKAKATLAKEERLKKAFWAESEGMTGRGGWVLWIALGAVVVVLLGVMARLLPKKE
ncbi:MAG: DUF3999 family protein [Thermodesulfobacteriota bacterium]